MAVPKDGEYCPKYYLNTPNNLDLNSFGTDVFSLKLNMYMIDVCKT